MDDLHGHEPRHGIHNLFNGKQFGRDDPEMLFARFLMGITGAAAPKWPHRELRRGTSPWNEVTFNSKALREFYPDPPLYRERMPKEWSQPMVVKKKEPEKVVANPQETRMLIAERLHSLALGVSSGMLCMEYGHMSDAPAASEMKLWITGSMLGNQVHAFVSLDAKQEVKEEQSP